MKTHQLKINFSNLKQEIEQDYFGYKDLFYKCLIVSLAIFHFNKQPLTGNTVLEDSGYNQLFQYFSSGQIDFRQMLDQISQGKPFNAAQAFIDVNIYTEEFITSRHVEKMLNLYDLTIDDSCNVVISNKHLRL